MIDAVGIIEKICEQVPSANASISNTGWDDEGKLFSVEISINYLNGRILRKCFTVRELEACHLGQVDYVWSAFEANVEVERNARLRERKG